MTAAYDARLHTFDAWNLDSWVWGFLLLVDLRHASTVISNWALPGLTPGSLYVNAWHIVEHPIIGILSGYFNSVVHSYFLPPFLLFFSSKSMTDLASLGNRLLLVAWFHFSLYYILDHHIYAG